MNIAKLMTTVLATAFVTCEGVEPEPLPAILRGEIISSFDGPSSAAAYVGDTVTIRVHALDDAQRAQRGVTIRADSATFGGTVGPQIRTTNAEGWADFSLRLSTAANAETGYGGSEVHFSAGGLSQIVQVAAVPLAPSSISILVDSLFLDLASKPRGSAPVTIRDQYGNPVAAGRALWIVRDPSIAQVNVAGGPTASILALQEGSTWVVVYSCNGKQWLCANSVTVSPADSVHITVTAYGSAL